MGPYRSCGRAGAALRPGLLPACAASCRPCRGVARCAAGQRRGPQSGNVAPPATRWVSTMWSLLIVWVRVFTRSSRCSTRARNAVVGIDLSAIESVGGDADRHRVGVVTFAAVSSREQPHPCRELGGDIDDINAVAAKPSGQRPPKAGRTFDRPSVHYGFGRWVSGGGCQCVVGAC